MQRDVGPLCIHAQLVTAQGLRVLARAESYVASHAVPLRYLALLHHPVFGEKEWRASVIE
eukprot:1141013-Pelagomonas_calceolata.AAC.2